MVAAGTLGRDGYVCDEAADYQAGAWVLKSTTLRSREGNAAPQRFPAIEWKSIGPGYSYYLNSVGTAESRN